MIDIAAEQVYLGVPFAHSPGRLDPLAQPGRPLDQDLRRQTVCRTFSVPSRLVERDDVVGHRH
ncbi:hypothetical protein [Streptomyces sp. TE5632]